MIEINLPWIDTALLPNRSNGRNWKATANAKTNARQLGRFETRRATLNVDSKWKLNDEIDYSIHIIFRPPRNLGPDVDGVLSALKPTLDGIAEALGVNDRRFNPIMITRGPTVIGGSVTVIVDELPFT